MADLQFTVDYKQLKEANKEISKVGSNAQKSASVFEAAFKKAEAQSVRSARAVREQITFSQRLERQKVRESKAAVAAATKVANEEERLRRKYIEGYAAMDIYSKELNELAVARKADIISAEEQRQAVDRLNRQMAAGTGVFSAYGAATKGNVKGTNNLGVMMQQTGYQVGDFAVQVQGGTNIAVAFGQQATQLVGALYLLPAPLLAAKVGILGLSISVTALIASFSIILPIVTGVVAYFMRTAEASRNAKEKVNSFEDALSSARTQLQGMKEDLRLLQSGLQSAFVLTLSDEVDKAREALSKAKQELDELYNPEVAVGESLANVVDLEAFKKSVELARERVLTATIELSTAKELSRQERQRARDASIAKQLYEARQIQLEQEQEKAESAAAATATYYAQMYTQLNESQIAGQELAEEMYQAFLNGEKLHEIKLEDGINAARLAAGRLSEELQISLAAAAEMVRVQQTAVYSGRGEGPQGVISGQFQPDDALYKEYLDSLREAERKGPTSETGQEALDKLVRQAENRRRLVDLTEEQARYEELLFQIQETNASKRDPLSQKELEAAAKKIYLIEEQTRVLEEQNKVQEALASTVESSMENAFMSIIDGTKSAKDAFKSMAADIIKELYRVLVVKRLVATVTGALGFADGGAFSGGSEVKAYANGGVVGGPTYFPMSGGKTGLMGEAGPEAIMPLKRGANGKLGVQMEGGGGDTIVVNQSFNFQANGDDSVKRIIAQAAPQIAQMTKKSIIDDRRRGGQMKATFG
jgi:hypothetical protein